MFLLLGVIAWMCHPQYLELLKVHVPWCHEGKGNVIQPCPPKDTENLALSYHDGLGVAIKHPSLAEGRWGTSHRDHIPFLSSQSCSGCQLC